MLTAAVLLPLLVWVVRLDSPRYFFLLASVAIVLAVLELFAMAERAGIHPHRTLGAAGAVLVATTFLAGGPELGGVLAGCTAAAPIVSLARRQPFAEALQAVATTLFGILFVGLLLGHQVGLRSLEGSGVGLLYYLLWVVWSSDAAAYLVGNRLGRRPLSPHLSPRKTLEGTGAGLAAALVASWCGRIWFLPELSWVETSALGLLLGVFALAGDLCESLLKRGSGVKDSAGLLPGHGGVLDRTDSLLFTGPILYHYWRWFHL